MPEPSSTLSVVAIEAPRCRMSRRTLHRLGPGCVGGGVATPLRLVWLVSQRLAGPGGCKAKHASPSHRSGGGDAMLCFAAARAHWPVWCFRALRWDFVPGGVWVACVHLQHPGARGAGTLSGPKLDPETTLSLRSPHGADRKGRGRSPQAQHVLVSCFLFLPSCFL